MSEEYVKPPTADGKNRDYVAPPKTAAESKEYVAPPKTAAESKEYVAPPKAAAENKEYVAPPKAAAENKEYVAPPKARGKEQDYRPTALAAKDHTQAAINDAVQPSGGTKYRDRQSPQSQAVSFRYFATPKVGARFYLTGYLIFMALFFLPPSWHSFTIARYTGSFSGEFSSAIGLLLLVGYILLSDYTYSWFADYQRAKGGSFAWFFTPFGSVKAGAVSSSFMNFQKGTVTKGMFGNYKLHSRTDVGKHIWFFFLIAIVLEFIKFFIAVPLAFISLFLHKETIRKYTDLAMNSK